MSDIQVTNQSLDKFIPRELMTKFEAAHAQDAVVIETTTNVWDIYDIIAPLVTRTVVAHAGAVRQIAEAWVKTDIVFSCIFKEQPNGQNRPDMKLRNCTILYQAIDNKFSFPWTIILETGYLKFTLQVIHAQPLN